MNGNEQAAIVLTFAPDWLIGWAWSFPDQSQSKVSKTKAIPEYVKLNRKLLKHVQDLNYLELTFYDGFASQCSKQIGTIFILRQVEGVTEQSQAVRISHVWNETS